MTLFGATTPSASLTIPITFNATDDLRVTGYMITTSSTPPLATGGGWTATAPTSYTVGAEGVYTLYPWVKDTSGHVSTAYSSPLSVTVDTTAPTVTAFSATAHSTSLAIPVGSFSASDSVGVTGYLITRSSAQPLASDAGWTALAPASYSVGSDGSYILYPWAKDAAGNVSALYGLPASVIVDTAPPSVVSSLPAGPNPTAQASVDFTVTFSEPVSGVGLSDFNLATSGVSGAAISALSGSGAVYTVTVGTGTGNGSMRLDVLDDNHDIQDDAGNPLNAAFSGGQAYTVNKPITLTLKSIGAQDGWVLESSQISNKGGSMNATATVLRLGDDAANRQYRGILSFNTSGLPVNATLQSAQLRIRQSGAAVGSNPFSVLGSLWADIRKGSFGAAALALTDFNAAASATKVGAFNKTPSGGWYTDTLSAAGLGRINFAGLTQFRLYFAKGDNNNRKADFMQFVSGNGPASFQPQLVIIYTLP